MKRFPRAVLLAVIAAALFASSAAALPDPPKPEFKYPPKSDLKQLKRRSEEAHRNWGKQEKRAQDAQRKAEEARKKVEYTVTGQKVDLPGGGTMESGIRIPKDPELEEKARKAEEWARLTRRNADAARENWEKARGDYEKAFTEANPGVPVPDDFEKEPLKSGAPGGAPSAGGGGTPKSPPGTKQPATPDPGAPGSSPPAGGSAPAPPPAGGTSQSGAQPNAPAPTHSCAGARGGVCDCGTKGPARECEKGCNPCHPAE